MKLKRILAIVVSITMICTMGIAGTAVAFGDSNTERLEEIEQQESAVQNELGEATTEYNKAAKELNAINEQVASKQSEINKIENDIAKTKSDMDSQENDLGLRLRVMYERGPVQFLTVILGSNSISEFLSNVEMVKKIHENDQETFTALQKQADALQEQNDKLKTEKEKLDALQATAQEKSDEAESKKNDLVAKIDQFEAEKAEIQAEIEATSSHGSGEITEGMFAWPAPGNYTITSPFDPGRWHPIHGRIEAHEGVDIGCPSGSRIVAAASGTVTIASWYGGYGNYVYVDHGNGVGTAYGHNSELLVSPGQHVERGETIAYSGSTGWSTGPHLHFEVRINGTAVDPMQYF